MYKKPLILLVIIIFSFNHVVAQTKTFDLYFATGQTFPSNISAFEDSLKEWNKTYLLNVYAIKGYADNVGSETSNLKLSQKRANFILAVMTKMNVPTEKTIVIGMGERKPKYSNKTAKSRSKNRRVRVIINYSIKLSPVVQVQEIPVKGINCGTPIPIDCLEKDTTIVLPQGTEIIIKGCSLEGTRVQDVKIVAEEYFTKDQMILNDMFTQTADGGCLSTGGMIRYKITDQSGKEIVLKPGKTFEMRVPQNTPDTVFNLYQMKQDEKTSENTGWEMRNESVKYNSQARNFSMQLSIPSLTMNLDCVKSMMPFKPKKRFVKTKVVKNGKVYANSDNTVIKLRRKRKGKSKRKFHDWNYSSYCLSDERTMVTVIAHKKDKIYYCHKDKRDLKQRNFFRRNYIVRKRDYTILLNEDELKERMKIDLKNE